jgi:Na+-driven multidrug efflux pump
VVSLFGSGALAGYTVAIRIIIFTILPSWGLSNAAATLVGQNLGANALDRAEKSVWKCAFYNLLFLGLVAFVFGIWASPIVSIVSNDPSVNYYGSLCLRIVCFGYVFFAYGMVMVQAFNGAGDTRTPTIINLVCYWVVQIPLAYTLAVGLELGPYGVFLAIAIAESLLAVVSIVVFRRGDWKVTRI